MTIEGPVLLVGGGKMGGALLDGWIAAGLAPGRIHVVDPSEATCTALHEKGVRAVTDSAALPADLRPQVVILAVKPQVMDRIIPPYAKFAEPETVFLSVAAGRTLASFAAHLGDAAAIVRSIPNTPAAIGRGMTVLCPNAHVTENQRRICETLLQAVGATDWVMDEALMDAATAVSGSGPAYVFHTIECLAAAGVAAGLPEDVAQRLALKTVAGAGALAEADESGPVQLRRNVTSPGGTTEAALNVLMEDEALTRLFRDAVAAAAQRGKELAG